MTQNRTALIVGAGIGGLAAGVALQRAGWRVRVFERASHPRELGFALSMAPNAMAALQDLGIVDRVLAEGHATARSEVRGPRGRVLKRMDVSQLRKKGPYPAVVALRPALHGALLSALPPDVMSLDSEVAAFESVPDGITITLHNGRRETGDVLIGADGAGSVIRRRLHPGEGPPRVSEYVAIRGVAHDAGYLLGDLSAIAYLGVGCESAIARASGTAVYWYMSLLADDVDAAQPARVTAESRAVVLGDDILIAMVRATAPGDIRFDALLDRDPLPSWGEGAVTLLGDAAHPMLPHAGQGAAQALEDAVALGLVLKPASDIPSALRRYEHVRSKRTAEFVRMSRRIPKMTTTRNRVVCALRNAAVRATPASVMLAKVLGPQPDPHRALR